MSLRRSFAILLLALAPWSLAVAATTRTRYAQIGNDRYRMVETVTDGTVSVRLDVAAAEDVKAEARSRGEEPWTELSSWSHTTEPFRARVVHAVGQDTMTITAPRAGRDLAESIPTAVEVEVNGVVSVVDFPALQRAAMRSEAEVSELEQGLAQLAGAFRDPTRFVDAVERFERLRAEAGSSDAIARFPTFDPCFRPCAQCAASTLAWAGSWLAISATCVGVVPSGGIILPGCLGAIISHGAINIALVSSCAECAACRVEQSRCCDCKDKPDRPDCDCGDRPACPPNH